MVKKNLLFNTFGVVFALAICFLFSDYTTTANAEENCVASLKTDPPAVPMIPPVLIGKFKIEGSGFKANDRVQIMLAGVDNGKDLQIASAEADQAGNFKTSIPPVTVLQGIYHFNFIKGRPTPDPKNPPLPPGTYTLKAISWDSPCTATCTFKMLAPPKRQPKK